MKTISAYKARTNFGELLNEVYYKGEEIVVERKGKAMVKISKVVNKSDGGKDFFKLAGILADEEAVRIKRMIKEGRRDGSRYKKFLLKW